MKHKKNKKDVIRGIAFTLAMLLIAAMCVLLGGCAPAETDGVETVTVCEEKSEFAIVRLPDGTIIQGNVEYHCTYSSGCIKITIDGVEYYTHLANVAIIESSK
jgi:hypothetical protein